MKPSKLLALKNNRFWPELKEVLYADIHSRGTKGKKAKGPEDFDNIMKDFETRTAGLGDAEEVKNKLKGMIDGRRIIQLTGAQGPEIGRIKDAVTEWILNTNPSATPEEIDDYIRKVSKG